MRKNRTDLALELKEEASKESRLEGITVKTRVDTANHIKETKITIENKIGEQIIGKPKGNYITIETKDLSSNDGGFHKEMSRALTDNLIQMLPKRASILIAGLGNHNVTADSLGPRVTENLYINRHFPKTVSFSNHMTISAISPGVMAQTGMETGEILKAVIDQTKPDDLIVIDALAARSSNRLNKTIQISDTGIAPGSGVGNHRHEITMETMGIPVLSVGVPTVISVPAIISDLFDDEEEINRLLEKLDEDFVSMHVTPKNIDEAVKRISFTISEGINSIMNKTISQE